MLYSSISKGFGEAFWELVREAGSILITTIKSDEDAISSVLAMRFILEQKYPTKNIKVAVRSYPSNRWCHLKGADQLMFVDDLSKYVQAFDLVVFLDCSRHELLKLSDQAVSSSQLRTVCIDHHSGKSDEFDLALVVPEATSTAELIYYTFCVHEPVVHPHLAEILLVGILGDTGTLKHIDAQKAHVYGVVQRLVTEQKINIDMFLATWKRYSDRELKIIQEFVKNMKIEHVGDWASFTLSSVSRGFVRNGKYTDLELGETASFFVSHFGTLLHETQWGAVLYPKSNGSVRVKARSQPHTFNIRKMMEVFLPPGGGGHENAGGGSFLPDAGKELDAPECITALRAWLLTHSYDRLLEKIEEK